MALFLPPGVEPETEEERADLDAINALRESAAYELKVPIHGFFFFFFLNKKTKQVRSHLHNRTNLSV
jgi:hypothetical protein